MNPPLVNGFSCLLASDFDQTLSFNDSGDVLCELLGIRGFQEKVAGLGKSNLIHQGAELAYLLRHDPEFRAVRREHLREAGKRVRLKEDLNIFARVLRENLPARFHFCVISASPREVVQSALEEIVPAENVFGTEFIYDDQTGEISRIHHVPAGFGKVAVLEHLQAKLHCTPDRTIYVGDDSSDLYVMHHVNSHDGCTVAVSETKSIARIARRTVLSDNALSVLIPVLEETLGWNAGQIRDLSTSCGVAIHGWDKIRTDWLTFHRTPTPLVVNRNGRRDSELVLAESARS
jgi:HAD superfamily phosphoserine phosphatase-like hydrolase